MRIFLASILNINMNMKFCKKTIFDWAIMGVGRIIPHSLKTMGNKNCFQPRPIFFCIKSYMTPSYLLKLFFKILSINCDRDGFMC
jgi:hypothetical protein